MSTALDTRGFITLYVNNCPLVKSSRLDKTIKATINYYKTTLKDIDYSNFINYLNKLRVVYYLKRLEYRDREKAREYKGTPLRQLRVNLY